MTKTTKRRTSCIVEGCDQQARSGCWGFCDHHLQGSFVLDHSPDPTVRAEFLMANEQNCEAHSSEYRLEALRRLSEGDSAGAAVLANLAIALVLDDAFNGISLADSLREALDKAEQLTNVVAS